jgi:hypothetical protein|tara:strand:- start:618 stop:2180 length:1563 start_codon:yes stop_codon:yes gene_type:complete
MANIFGLESTGDVAAGAADSRLGTDLSTGALRRKFNFGDRVSELAIAQDPFFRMISKLSKKPTDDPEFKFTERRPSYHKRYAYVVAFDDNGTVEVHDSELERSDSTAVASAVGHEVGLYMATDYKSSGNLSSVYGQSSDAVTVGGTGTRPEFFLPGQLVKVPVMAATTGTTITGYHIIKVTSVVTSDLASNAGVDNDSMECKLVKGDIVKFQSGANEVASFAYGAAAANNGFQTGSSNGSNEVYDRSISEHLEPIRSHVVGTAHEQGSGYPDSWKDQPFSTGYGRTQIWKTAMAMDNTTRATVLKYEPNEWARTWREKLIEHKWDIEQSCLFGSQYDSGSEYYTQGAVDYVSGYGNTFSLTHSSKTQDDFLDDMSNFLDPRYNNASATLFFCDTATYNWLHKLSGYFTNNLEISSNFRAEMSLSGKKKVFGVEITTISTPFGDMNVTRNVHLDAHPIKMLAVNMRYCSYRPLVGNGLNRDTAIYVGVQTLENSGVDRRVDLIQTEAGMEWQMPEAHAYWS